MGAVKRLIAVAVSIAAISVANTSTAFAHAEFIGSNPKANSTVKSLPATLWAEFGEKLMVIGDKNPNSISVTDSKKLKVNSGPALISGARISTKLKTGLSSGKYLVSYRIVSEDGHIVNGKFSFTYKPS